MKTQNMKSSKPVIGRKIGWGVMLLMSMFVTLLVSRYLSLDPDVFFPEQRTVYLANLVMLVIHIVGSMLALIIGPFQFLPAIRKGGRLKVHRWLGRTYLLGVLFGGLGGLYMARLAYGGVITGLGFTGLACLWLYTGYQAYRHIRAKDIEAHRRWMIRNYALTFAAVMLRVWMPVSVVLGADFTAAYIVVAWACWAPNLLVAEWIIRRTLPLARHSPVVVRDETHRTVQTEFYRVPHK